MTEPTFLEPLTFGRAFGLWLATIGLGTLFIALFFVFLGDSGPAIALIAGAIAAGCSLPALLFLPFCIKWALSGGTAPERQLRLLGFITALFGLATLVCYLAFTSDGDSKSGELAITIAEFAAPYFVAALLAAYWFYRDWLRTPEPE